MIEKLTESDIKRMENLNLFRVGSYTYGPIFFVGIFSFFLSLTIPYNGWRKKPLTPPKDFDEYVHRLIPYLILSLIFILLPMINWTIKSFDLKKGIKKVTTRTVILKSSLLFKRKIICFKPFKVIIYRRTYHFMDIEKGDKAKVELTYLGRLLHYQKIN